GGRATLLPSLSALAPRFSVPTARVQHRYRLGTFQVRGQPNVHLVVDRAAADRFGFNVRNRVSTTPDGPTHDGLIPGATLKSRYVFVNNGARWISAGAVAWAGIAVA